MFSSEKTPLMFTHKQENFAGEKLLTPEFSLQSSFEIPTY